jgi:glycosyltransferase involved in cell wall biosynthesis
VANLDPEWICCQLGAREHYAVARALHRRYALNLLLTDAWIRRMNPFGQLAPGLRTRFHPDLETANVYAPNLGNIAFKLRSKLAGLRGWPLIIARNEWFQDAVVANLSRIGSASKPRTLFAYSYAALKIFKFARARGWRTVLGQIDPGPPEERIVAKLYEQNKNGLKSWHPAPSHYWSNWREECALADRIVVNSNWSRMSLIDEGISAEKIKVVPVAFEESGAGPAFGRQYPRKFSHLRPLRVLFLGQINLRKGFGPLVGAIQLLCGEPVEFWFVGPVQIPIPPDLRYDPQVRWLGPVSRDDTTRFYRNADVFLFPTLSDGFGLTQLEAQAWKLPLVTTKFCGDVVTDCINGRILSDVTSTEIAANIRHLLSDPARLQKFSDNSGLAGRFSLARVGEQWLELFD